jgi:hypothetical protein
MVDLKAIRRRVLLRMLGSPFVTVPFMLGMTVLTATWALGWRTGLGIFAALAGLLAAVGAFFTRVILDDGRTAQTILQETQQAEMQSQQAVLDELDRRLVAADSDPRPETALRDLRALLQAFDAIARQADAAHLQAIFGVRDKVQEIFEQSVRSVEHTLKLGDTAKQLQTAAAREPILEQRERIVRDLEASVRQLGGTLAALQGLSAGGGAHAELTRLRDELDQSLAVASRVESRLNALLDRANAEVRTQPLTNQEKG